MARARTAELLRRAYEAGDPHAAVELLEQSIALRHRRVALLRYLQAQRLSAPLDARHHEYAQQVAARLSGETLARLLDEARRRGAWRASGPDRN